MELLGKIGRTVRARKKRGLGFSIGRKDTMKGSVGSMRVIQDYVEV